MLAQYLLIAITTVFIIGMIWLRTRLHYAQRGGGALRLQPAGRIYFAAALGVLVIGWFAAPLVGRALWPGAAVTPTLMRVVWCLATYYVFILVHRVLKSRGTVVFRQTEPPG
ncbi:MAG TPA: hypothetical protein VGL55_14770 [Steroidobacteraceae bacterium]|jgi:hypothetical protein